MLLDLCQIYHPIVWLSVINSQNSQPWENTLFGIGIQLHASNDVKHVVTPDLSHSLSQVCSSIWRESRIDNMGKKKQEEDEEEEGFAEQLAASLLGRACQVHRPGETRAWSTRFWYREVLGLRRKPEFCASLSAAVAWYGWVCHALSPSRSQPPWHGLHGCQLGTSCLCGWRSSNPFASGCYHLLEPCTNLENMRQPSDQTHREQQQTHHNKITQTKKQNPTKQALISQSYIAPKLTMKTCI